MSFKHEISTCERARKLWNILIEDELIFIFYFSGVCVTWFSQATWSNRAGNIPLRPLSYFSRFLVSSEIVGLVISQLQPYVLYQLSSKKCLLKSQSAWPRRTDSELKTWKPNDYLLSPIWCLPEVRIQVSKYIQQKSWFLSPNCFIFHVSLIKYYPSRKFKNWIIYESSLHITTYSPK